MTEPKIVAIVRIAEFRGDHSAEIELLIEPLNGETVTALVGRARAMARQHRSEERGGLAAMEIALKIVEVKESNDRV